MFSKLLHCLLLLLISYALLAVLAVSPVVQGLKDLKRSKRSLTTICVEIRPSSPKEEPYFMCKGAQLPSLKTGGNYDSNSEYDSGVEKSSFRPATYGSSKTTQFPETPHSGFGGVNGFQGSDGKSQFNTFDQPQHFSDNADHNSFQGSNPNFSNKQFDNAAKSTYSTQQQPFHVFKSTTPPSFQHFDSSTKTIDPANPEFFSDYDSFPGEQGAPGSNFGFANQQSNGHTAQTSQHKTKTPTYTPSNAANAATFKAQFGYSQPSKSSVHAPTSAFTYNTYQSSAESQSINAHGAAGLPGQPAFTAAHAATFDTESSHAKSATHASATPTSSASVRTAIRPAAAFRSGAFMAPAAAATANGPYLKHATGTSDQNQNKHFSAKSPDPTKFALPEQQNRGMFDEDVLATPNWGFQQEELNLFRPMQFNQASPRIAAAPADTTIPLELRPTAQARTMAHMDDPLMRQFYASLQEPQSAPPRLPIQETILGMAPQAPVVQMPPLNFRRPLPNLLAPLQRPTINGEPLVAAVAPPPRLPLRAIFENFMLGAPAPAPRFSLPTQGPMLGASYAPRQPQPPPMPPTYNEPNPAYSYNSAPIAPIYTQPARQPAKTPPAIYSESYAPPPTGPSYAANNGCNTCQRDYNIQPIFIALPCYGNEQKSQQSSSYGAGPTVGMGNPLGNMFGPPSLFSPLGLRNPMANLFGAPSLFPMLGAANPMLGSTQNTAPQMQQGIANPYAYYNPNQMPMMPMTPGHMANENPVAKDNEKSQTAVTAIFSVTTEATSKKNSEESPESAEETDLSAESTTSNKNGGAKSLEKSENNFSDIQVGSSLSSSTTSRVTATTEATGKKSAVDTVGAEQADSLSDETSKDLEDGTKKNFKAMIITAKKLASMSSKSRSEGSEETDAGGDVKTSATPKVTAPPGLVRLEKRQKSNAATKRKYVQNI